MEYINCNQEGQDAVIQKLYPNIINVYSIMKVLTIPIKCQAPPQQVELFLRDLQLKTKLYDNFFLKICSLATTINQITQVIQKVNLLTQGQLISLSDLLKIPQKNEQIGKLGREMLQLVYVKLLELQQKIFHIDYRCFEICLKQTKSGIEVVLTIKPDPLVIDLNKQYKKGDYAKKFRDYYKILITKACQGLQYKSTEQKNIQLSNAMKQLIQKIRKQKKIIQDQEQVFYRLEAIQSMQVSSLFQLSKNLFQSKTRLYNKIVEQKQRLINKNFDWHPIQFKDPNTGNQIKDSIYSNPICPHFDGFSRDSIVKVYSKCQKCGATLVADPNKLYLYQNQFMMMLRQNPLNPLGKRVLYSFKNHIFIVQKFNNYTNYSHYAQFFKKTRAIKDRPDHLLNLNLQKLFLANRIYSESISVNLRSLIKTPVRGFYCKHIGFYDLSQVYREQITNPDSKSFECYICLKQVAYSDLIFLQQIQNLLNWIKKKGVITQQFKLLQLTINHQKKQIKLIQKKNKQIVFQQLLTFYDAIMDPRVEFKDQQEQKAYQKALLDQYNDLSKHADRSDSQQDEDS